MKAKSKRNLKWVCAKCGKHKEPTNGTIPAENCPCGHHAIKLQYWSAFDRSWKNA